MATLEHTAILSTGDELTTGRTQDTNASFLADRLVGIGLEVVAILVVGDDAERITWAWRQAIEQAELVICTGGLGPTADDLTTPTLGAMLERRLVLDEQVASRIRQLFESMGRTMPENNLRQAQFPEGAVILPNRLGTAPGYRLEVENARGLRHVVVLPGVPREMKPMFDEQVVPWLRALRGSDEIFLAQTFQTFGISESGLDQLLAGALEPNEGRLSFRAAFPQVSVRVLVKGTPGEAEARLQSAAQRIRARIGEYCYAEGEVSMEEVVGRLLTERGTTLAVAESCTGGLIGHRLTNVPGSSAYLRADLVAYSNPAKESLLGVRPETLAAHGAVSVETAAEMADGARRATAASVGLAVTGIAGPDGGTADKPVGTVCIAIATGTATYRHRYQLWGTRDWIKLLSSQIALDWVRRICLDQDPTRSGVLKK